MNSAQEFFKAATYQNHPMRVLIDLLEQETRNEKAKNYDHMRFVGYILNISYNDVTIITSDPYKIYVGGIPRSSLLIMVPSEFGRKIPPHFTVLRVLEAAPTPLEQHVQQTFFELQKRSMPELDVFTQSELQWGALHTTVLGMFYPKPNDHNEVEFACDMNNFVSAHKYRVYKPDNKILDLIINSLVPLKNRFTIGTLRLTENRLDLFNLSNNSGNSDIDVQISTLDLMGTRTALFGKTRLGKSNIIKLIAQSLIETTQDTKNVGQVIFDVNGEYANDNPQDNNSSLASSYQDSCEIYAITSKPNTPSKPLKLNFYEYPERSIAVLANLLHDQKRDSARYVANFISANIPSLDVITDSEVPKNIQLRSRRRILMYWAILKKAGFDIDEKDLLNRISDRLGVAFTFDPKYNQNLRTALYGGEEPPKIRSLDNVFKEFELIINYIRSADENDPLLRSTGSGHPLFDPDDLALLNFLDPTAGTGPALLIPYRGYHDRNAGDFIKEIIQSIDIGKTVIIDLGNANPEVMTYFSVELSQSIFMHQVEKFSSNNLGNHFIQLYFEEAHNLFPQNEDSKHPSIYRRLAKEGAKYHIGMVYATQSPSTINKDLIAQTENFFIAHLSSRGEVRYLSTVNVAFELLEDDILNSKTPGYVRILTRSHRFVIPVQALKFETINN